jgi:benzylsuccinate CoA-transferase BbsE subunit
MEFALNRDGALSGCRVLDLTDEKGMFCSRLLADMGAQVIRVERPHRDTARSSFSLAANAGKLDITLDIGVEKGREIFKRLVKTTDVLVESYQPGYLASLGIGYSGLSAINPRLIVTSITGFGQDGPYRDYKSGDAVACAAGGWTYVCGEPQSPPLKPPGKQSYCTAGLFAATGVVLALWDRHTTGKGQHIDISLQECVAATLDHVMVRYFYDGVVAERRGGLHWNNAFRVFPCRDGYILLSLFQQWDTLVEWLAAEGMAGDLTDEKWRDGEERLRAVEHIAGVLERWTKSHTVAELVEKGQLMRFPWAEVTSIEGLMSSPQLRERGFWVEIEPPASGNRYRFPGAMAKMSRSPWQVGGRVAGSGEHNTDIYRRELGLSEVEVEALSQEDVI